MGGTNSLLFFHYILWPIDPLLRSDRKQVPTATNQHATEDLLEAVFSVVLGGAVAT
jgi:hypothetical protein